MKFEPLQLLLDVFAFPRLGNPFFEDCIQLFSRVFPFQGNAHRRLAARLDSSGKERQGGISGGMRFVGTGYADADTPAVFGESRRNRVCRAGCLGSEEYIALADTGVTGVAW